MTFEQEPSVETVRALIAEQFPAWAGLDVREVTTQGWDNRTYRLGQELSVRLPSADGYAPQVEREHRWLPFLAPWLPLPIPEPVVKGEPTELFPRVWSVYRWLSGVPLSERQVRDDKLLAADLAGFLRALRQADVPADAPVPEDSNGWRGAPFECYLAEGLAALEVLGDPRRRRQGRDWLHAATNSAWSAAPTWIHGDVASGNLLVDEERLCAVIDFGCLAVGDPACDLTVAWTLFERDSAWTFRVETGLDDDTWIRARGWALWKAVITLASAAEGSARHVGAETTVRRLWEDPS